MASRVWELKEERAGRRAQARATPPIQTSSQRSSTVRYSYTETPLEMHAPQFNHPPSSPTNSTIDESPITPASPSRSLPPYSYGNGAPPVTSEKGKTEPPQEVHPAYFAPYKEETLGQDEQQQHPPRPAASLPGPSPDTQAQLEPIPQQRHGQSASHGQASNMHPAQQRGSANSHTVNQSPDPIMLTSPGGTTSAPTIPTIQSPIEPESKPNIEPDISYAAPPLHATKTDPSSHLPGQAVKNSSDATYQFKHGLCDPSPVCCTATFCPCVVYGKNMYRLSRKQAKQDPTDLLGYEACNGACTVMALACGAQWVLAWIERMRVRKLYEIEGSAVEDCFKAVCCCCCVLAQDEREMKDREEEMVKRFDGRATTAPYASPAGMAYAPPPR